VGNHGDGFYRDIGRGSNHGLGITKSIIFAEIS
jgi:hypothetical protein